MLGTLAILDREDRDEALARVLKNAGFGWRFNAIQEILRLSPNEVTGEDIRLHCEGLGIRPHNNNAWGALIMSMIKDGTLKPTGEYRAMVSPQSHARRTQVLRINRETARIVS